MTEPKKPALELQLPPRWQALVERTMAADAKGGGSRQGRHMGGGGHHGMHRQVVRARDARGSFLRLLRALRGRTLSDISITVKTATAKKISLFSAITIVIGAIVGSGVFFKNIGVFKENHGNAYGIVLS